MSIKDKILENNSLTHLGLGEELTIKRKEALIGIGLILPSIIVVTIVILYPLLYNIYLSFTVIPLDPSELIRWVGLEHYRNVLTSESFWSALQTTIIYTLVSDILATTAGLLVAVLLNREFRGLRGVRSLILLPYIAPIIAVAFTWRWMLDPLHGYLPYLLTNILNLVDSFEILTDPQMAIWGAIVFAAWKYFPFAYLFLIARLQAIDEQMYEAAELDGASKFAQFKDITLPELKTALAAVFLIRWIWQFNVYEDVWLLTHQVTTLSVYIYQTAFASFERGLGAAISILLVLSLLIFVAVYSQLTMTEDVEINP